MRKRDNFSNAELVLLLCKARAFNEGDATRVLSQTPEGVELMFKPRFSERIRTAVSVGRVLVFQETISERFLRAKNFDKKNNDECNSDSTLTSNFCSLCEFCEKNNINPGEFAETTYKHFTGALGKKNNFFFLGAPSTGKTMVMTSLADAQFNTGKLTGLASNSSFNFASIVHCNACFMDECKLTNNQFEQWKLLAANADMNTDVKYKERHIISNCILYTCANFPIEMYVNVPEASEAVATRTTTYRFFNKDFKRFLLTTWDWEYFWKQFGFEI